MTTTSLPLEHMKACLFSLTSLWCTTYCATRPHRMSSFHFLTQHVVSWGSEFLFGIKYCKNIEHANRMSSVCSLNSEDESGSRCCFFLNESCSLQTVFFSFHFYTSSTNNGYEGTSKMILIFFCSSSCNNSYQLHLPIVSQSLHAQPTDMYFFLWLGERWSNKAFCYCTFYLAYPLSQQGVMLHTINLPSVLTRHAIFIKGHLAWALIMMHNQLNCLQPWK